MAEGGWGQYEDIEAEDLLEAEREREAALRKGGKKDKNKSGPTQASEGGTQGASSHQGDVSARFENEKKGKEEDARESTETVAVKATETAAEEADVLKPCEAEEETESKGTAPAMGDDPPPSSSLDGERQTSTNGVLSDLEEPSLLELAPPGGLPHILSETQLASQLEPEGGSSYLRENGTGALQLDVAVSTVCPNYGSLEAAHQRVFDSGLTFSEAKGQIWKLRKRGYLLKRGFRYRKRWLKRYVMLSGRMLKYYEHQPKDDHEMVNARDVLELTKNTVVEAVPNGLDGTKFGFHVIPPGALERYRASQAERGMTVTGAGSGEGAQTVSRGTSGAAGGWGLASWFGGKNASLEGEGEDSHEATGRNRYSVWRFQARNEREKQSWMAVIQKAITLIRRVEVAPTLSGVGSVHYHYKMDQVVGRGQFGNVYAAVATMTGQEYAIKVIDKERRVKTKEDALVLRAEIKIMRRITRELDHTNICKLFQAYEDSFMVYLVMERLDGGDLVEHIAEFVPTYTEAVVADIVRQVAGALVEIHRAGIVLCDLRPENLLFKSADSSVVKVVEFGRAVMKGGSSSSSSSIARLGRAARRMPSDRDLRGPDGEAATFTPGVSGRRRSSRHGSIASGRALSPYLAPEVVSTGWQTPACDVWALGAVLFTLLVGYPPFSGKRQGDLFKSISRGLQADNLNKEDWKDVSPGARLLIGSMLRSEPDVRVDAAAILEDDWVLDPPGTPLTQAHARIRRIFSSRSSAKGGAGSSARSPRRKKVLTPPPRRVAEAGNASNATQPGQGSKPVSGLRQNWSASDLRSSGGSSRDISSPDGLGDTRNMANGAATVTGIKPSMSTFFQLLNEGNGTLDADRRAEVLALDVRAQRIRSSHNRVSSGAAADPDGLYLEEDNFVDEDSQATFAPAGRFLNDLEGQMRRVREAEREKLASMQEPRPGDDDFVEAPGLANSASSA
ncbi:Calcium-dependent protein kinase 2 (PfCDPK2), partial [Durusdinium trenchii]